MQILVAEDKPQTADLLRRALESEGHSVLLAYDGAYALTLGKSKPIDVILLDIMLPRLDGFSVISELRGARNRTPIIIVSARDAMSDIIHGLDLGADDYLTKPFELKILLAHVRALSRRTATHYQEELKYQDLILKPASYELKRGERIVSLTRTEYALLEILMRRAGSVAPRSVLIEEGWGLDSDVSEANLYVFIRSLRAKITQPGEQELLQTVRGIGYSLRSTTH
jgi:DNA-binding response OmpR family regulator